MKNSGMRLLAIFSFLSVLMWSIPLRGQEPVKVTRSADQIQVTVGGKPFTTYYFSAKDPKPYLHPLRSAAGTIVTRGFPMVKNIPGEDHDHPHHRAMFFTHGDINGIDFWGEAQFEEKSPVHVNGKTYSSESLPNGQTVFTKLLDAKGGAHSGHIKALFNLVGPDKAVVAEETQDYIFSGSYGDRIIDCEFTIRALDKPVKMGDTKEGTFGIRVVKDLHPPNGKMTNSNGAVGEDAIWGKRADWVDYSAKVGDEDLGITIFDNPTNPKHPTYWHARAYGLFAVNPFGEHDYYHDPKRDGSITIQPGKSLTFRYRVLIHHGLAAQADLPAQYKAYSSAK